MKNKNHLFVICGKSNSGKDSVMRGIEAIIKHNEFNLQPLVTHTTRPPRPGEVNGVDYFFDTVNDHDNYLMENKICEVRKYEIINDNSKLEEWKYYTLIDDIKPNKNYIMINTPEGIVSIINYLQDEKSNIENEILVHAIWIECDDKTLIERAMNREIKKLVPNYKELMRRFVADIDDFSDNVLRKLTVKASTVKVFNYLTPIPITHRIFSYIVETILDTSDKSFEVTDTICDEK